MIENIRKIVIQNSFFDTKKTFEIFSKSDRISIVFGRNGSGKSTLAKAIENHKNNIVFPGQFFDILDSNNQSIKEKLTLANTFVFNEDYIDKNIKTQTDGLNTIVLLGEQVDLQKQIDSLNEQVTVKSSNLTKEQEKFDEEFGDSSSTSPQCMLNNIMNSLKQKGGWADRDREIKGNKTNTPVTADLVKEINNLQVTESRESLEEIYDEKIDILNKIKNGNTSSLSTIPTISYDEKFDENICNLLNTIIKEPKLTAREQKILEIAKNGRQKLVEDAFKEMQATIEFCPFCFQKIEDNYKNVLIEEIKHVLNKETDDYRALLNQFNIPDLPLFNQIETYKIIDENLISTFTQKIQICRDIRIKYQQAIEEKKEHIFSASQFNSLNYVNSIKELNNVISEINNKIKQINVLAAQASVLKRDILTANKKIAYYEIKKAYDAYEKRKDEKRIKEAKLNDVIAELKLLEKNIKDLTAKKFNVNIAIEKINNLLRYIFYSNTRLLIEIDNQKYCLKSNGNPVSPKNISVGERNIIALCYFFIQLMENQSISNLYRQETFIVIDDPISSFDFENKVGVISFLRCQLFNILIGNPNSKCIILSHDLTTIFDLLKIKSDIQKENTSALDISKANNSPHYFLLENKDLKRLESKQISEYHDLLSRLYNFANGDNSDEITIGNIMRRVMEIFATFNYRKGIEEVSYINEIKQKLGDKAQYFEHLMYRLVLHGDSHYEEQCKTMHDDGNFFRLISADEKRRTAKDILSFIYCLNDLHLKMYLDVNNNQATTNINSWVLSIR